MPTGDSGPSLLEKTEIKTAIENLPRVSWLRLHQIARALCRHIGSEPDDLLQEAFQRALNGRRRCPRDVDIVRFLAGVMRSIASDWSKARKRRPEVSLIAPTGMIQEVAMQLRDPQPNPHDSLAGEQEATRMKEMILDLFADDLVAQNMLSAIFDGAEGENLRSLTDLNETEFASKRRLIRRRIDKAFAKELKP